jgi:energy-converting hydrogenase Eha subunit A
VNTTPPRRLAKKIRKLSRSDSTVSPLFHECLNRVSFCPSIRFTTSVVAVAVEAAVAVAVGLDLGLAGVAGPVVVAGLLLQ